MIQPDGRASLATRDAVRATLRERHLTNGYVTADSMDWLLDQLVNQARAAGQRIDRDALRDLYGTNVGENAVHGSDSVENARIEIAWFFAGSEVSPSP